MLDDWQLICSCAINYAASIRSRTMTLYRNANLAAPLYRNITVSPCKEHSTSHQSERTRVQYAPQFISCRHITWYEVICMKQIVVLNVIIHDSGSPHPSRMRPLSNTCHRSKRIDYTNVGTYSVNFCFVIKLDFFHPNTFVSNTTSVPES
jgi:hypothetical protein